MITPAPYGRRPWALRGARSIPKWDQQVQGAVECHTVRAVCSPGCEMRIALMCWEICGDGTHGSRLRESLAPTVLPICQFCSADFQQREGPLGWDLFSTNSNLKDAKWSTERVPMVARGRSTSSLSRVRRFRFPSTPGYQRALVVIGERSQMFLQAMFGKMAAGGSQARAVGPEIVSDNFTGWGVYTVGSSAGAFFADMVSTLLRGLPDREEVEAAEVAPYR